MEERLLIGYDLGEYHTQISCFNRETLEPDTVGMDVDKDNFLIPTALFVTKENREWLFGNEALTADKEDGVAVTEILKAARKEKSISIFGKEFSPQSLLEKFFRKTLALLSAYYPTGKIEKLVVSVEGLNIASVHAIYAAMDAIGLHRDRLSVISRMQSYYYYALSRKKELWLNDVGMFDYGEDGLKYYQLSLNRQTNPMIAGVTCRDFSNTMRYDLLNDPQERDMLPVLFSNIAQTVLHRQVVSTLYMTGIGFNGTWANDILRSLCVGRRVFKGMNLYCAGACYAAKAISENQPPEFLFLGDGVIHHEVSIPATAYGKDVELTLAEPAKPWYEQKAEVELILNGEEEIELYIRDILKKEEIIRSIPLHGLPKRPEKMTRLSVKLHFLDEHHFVVTVRDEGFGEFYASSDRVWEKIVEIT